MNGFTLTKTEVNRREESLLQAREPFHAIADGCLVSYMDRVRPRWAWYFEQLYLARHTSGQIISAAL